MSILLSFLYGLKHATEADHIAAMTLLINDNQRPANAIKMGAFWGFGHGLMLCCFGIIAVELNKEHIALLPVNPEKIVGCILLLMSVLWAFKMLKGTDQSNPEPSKTNPNNVLANPYGQAFQIGLVHGVAGSAAATLLVSGFEQSVTQTIIKLSLFGLGGMLGMAILCWFYSVNFKRLEQRNSYIAIILQILCIIFAAAIGLNLILRAG